MDEDDHYWKPLSVPPITKQPRATSQAQKGRDRLLWISDRAQQVFASYRRDDFADPDRYKIGLIALLERFPDKVIEEATDRNNGIQTVSKWPPSIAEVKEFCTELQRRSTYASDWDKRSREQLDERDRFNAEKNDAGNLHVRFDVESREKREEVVAKFKADLAQYGMQILVEKGTQAPFTPTAEIKKQYSVTDEQWDAIPDTPAKP